MTQISGQGIPKPLVDDRPLSLTLEHGLMGSLLSVALFGVLALSEGPISWILVKGFILSVAVAAIASIGLVGRGAGLLSPRDDELSRLADRR